MAELKTKVTEANVEDFLREYTDSKQKEADSFEILRIMQDESGFEPKMWGDSIIGFGNYHYKSERSSQEGDWFMVGFSPRKSAISLYIYNGGAEQEKLLKDLGKYKMGKACIYIKKLNDINESILRKIIKSSITFLQKKYPAG